MMSYYTAKAAAHWRAAQAKAEKSVLICVETTPTPSTAERQLFNSVPCGHGRCRNSYWIFPRANALASHKYYIEQRNAAKGARWREDGLGIWKIA